MENKKELDNDLLLLPDDVVPLPHPHSLTQTLHRDLHRAGILNSLYLLPTCSVVLRCVTGPTNGSPPLNLPNLRNTSYFARVKWVIVYAEGCLGLKVGTTLDFVHDRGTRFTVTTEFFNYSFDLSTEHTGGENIKLSASVAEVLCAGSHRYVKLDNYQCPTTLILSRSVVDLYLELLAKPEHPNVYKSLRVSVLFIALSLLTSNLVRCLLDNARACAEVGLLLTTITLAYPSTHTPDDLAAVEKLRECVERVGLLFEDEVLDWNLDKYFLDGV